VLDAASRPSRNGKNASDAITDRSVESAVARFHGRDAARDDPLIWPAPMRRVMPSFAYTMAFDVDVLADLPGEHHVRHLAERRRAHRYEPAVRTSDHAFVRASAAARPPFTLRISNCELLGASPP